MHLYIDDKYSISKTKKVLKEIFQQFDKIKIERGPKYFPYHITVEEYDFLSISPPPQSPPLPTK